MGGPIVGFMSGSLLINSAFWGRYVSTFLLAWITGSVFYRIPLTTTGLVSAQWCYADPQFLRGGGIFSALICE